jgi:uncharacterized membrane protein YidH (DUF202 family)
MTGPAGGPGPARSGQSDPGLAAERTSLAWFRMGLALIGIPSAVMAYTAGHAWVAFGAAALAAVLGMGMLTVSVRRQRAGPNMVERGDLRLATGQVAATAAAVLLLAVASLDLVLA